LKPETVNQNRNSKPETVNQNLRLET